MGLAAAVPNIVPEARYSGIDAARALGISWKTLRRWTLAGKIKVRFRKVNGRPCYLGRDLMSLWRADF